MTAMPLREAGSGPPLMLLHGWTLHGGFFPAQFAGLAGEARLIAPDLPGHGANRNAPVLTIEAAAESCAALIEERDLRGVVLVGWSMGAAVAWSLLKRHRPARVAGLVVIDMSPRVLNGPEWRLGSRDGIDAARSERVTAAMPQSWPRYAAHVAKTIFAEGIEPDPAKLAFVRAEADKADPIAMAAMWRSLVAQDFRGFLPEIDLPVLIVAGACSRLYAPEVARWQEARLRRGEVLLLPRSGHAPHLEEPEAVNAALGAFRRRL